MTILAIYRKNKLQVSKIQEYRVSKEKTVYNTVTDEYHFGDSWSFDGCEKNTTCPKRWAICGSETLKVCGDR